jgi:hypothetical protein
MWLLLVSTALALLLSATAQAAPDDVTVEAEGMSRDNGAGAPQDPAASAGYALELWGAGPATADVTARRSTVHMFIRAKPSHCGAAPEIVVTTSGRTIFAGPVNGDGYQDIGVRTSLPPGRHQVQVALMNGGAGYIGPLGFCNRGVRIDSVTLVASPFAPTGWRNKRLSKRTPIARNSKVLRDELRDQIRDSLASGRPEGTGVWVATDRWSVPIYTVPPGQPRVRVRSRGGSAALQRQWNSVPLPPDARPAAGNPDRPQDADGYLVVWQPSTDTLWEFIGLRKEVTGDWTAYYGGRMPYVSRNDGNFGDPPGGPGRLFGATATSISLLAGTQRIEEIRRGLSEGDLTAIDHAIDFGVVKGRGRAGFCWPAQRTDGFARSLAPQAIPAGTRFRFPADLDLARYDLSPYARLVAEAIKRHGMVARDTGGLVGFAAEDPTPTGQNPYPEMWGGRDPSARPGGLFANFPWSKLQALAPQGFGCRDTRR